MSTAAPAPCTGELSMIAVSLPLRMPLATAFSNVLLNSSRSASARIIRWRNRLSVVAAIPAKSSSAPIAAFQSASTRVRLAVSASEVLSWVAHSIARTITDGGIDGRPIRCAYRSA